MDGRHPRTRLAIIGTLMENGAPAEQSTLELAKSMVDWACEGVDALLADYLRDALNNIPEEEEVEPEIKTARRDHGSYL